MSTQVTPQAAPRKCPVCGYDVPAGQSTCPRCGAQVALSAEERRAAATHADPEFPEGTEGFKRVLAIVLFLAAVLFGLGGFLWLPLLVAGGASAGAGLVLLQSARAEEEENRAKLLQGLQGPVLRLAGERGGRLTAAEVSAALGWPLPRAERVLLSMEDGLRVTGDLTDEGVVVFRFIDYLPSPSSPRSLPGGEGPTQV